MKSFKLFYFSVFLLIHEITVCMNQPRISREEKIQILKENPNQINEILKTKNCFSCFGTSENIEIAEEAQRELAQDTSRIQSLKPDELEQKIITFNPYEIKLLKKAQLNDLSLEAVSKLQKNQLLAFTQERLKQIITNFQSLFEYNNPADRTNVYSDISNIKNILGIISNISEISNSEEIKNFLYILKRTIYQNLNPQQLQEISDHLKNDDIIEAIKYHFNYQLGDILKEKLTHNFLNNPNEFNPEHIQFLNINKIEPFDIPHIKPEQIKKLRLDQIKNLTNEQVESLTSNQVHAFSKGHLINLSSKQIDHLLASNKLSLEQISSLPSSQFKLIDNKILKDLSLNQLKALRDNQIETFPTALKFYLLNKLIDINSPDSIKIIKQINDLIKGLPEKYFESYNQTLFKKLKNKIPDLSSFAFLKKLTINDIKALTQKEFDSLDQEEKNDIFYEIENHYQIISAKNIANIINEYRSPELQKFIYNLANQKATNSTQDLTENFTEDLTEDLTEDFTQHIAEIKKIDNATVKNILDEGYSANILKDNFNKTLSDYYKNSSYEEIQKDFQTYNSSFAKKILIKIMNEKDANSPRKKDSRVNTTKKVTIDEAKNIVHSHHPKDSNLNPNDFFAKSTTQDEIVLLNDQEYNKLIDDIRKYYKDKDTKSIIDDVKFYRSKNLQLFLYELIRDKSKSQKPAPTNVRMNLPPSQAAKSSADFTSSDTANSSSDNVQTSTNDSNNNLEENLFHTPQ